MATIKEIFEKRKDYDESNPDFQLPDLPSLYTKYYIDTWNVIPFYGKVDTFGIPVIPRDNLVRYCTYGTDKKQYQSLQPTAQFFFSLRQEYEKYFQFGNINKNSPFLKKDLTPFAGFTNPSVDYFDRLQIVYNNFINNLLVNNKLNSVKNYNDFINELLIYIKTNNLYLTRAGYVESYDYSLLNTGLAIDLYDGVSTNDDDRIKFYNDVNQEALLELCVRNNFKVDREIPWRIFLDIRTKTDITNKQKTILSFSNKIPEVSPKIEDFIPEFKEDLQLFFDVYYIKTIPCDQDSLPYFEEFVSILQSFYKSFSTSYPFYRSYDVNDCGKANVLKINREIIIQNELQYDRAEYVKLYLNFRSAELSKVVPEEKLKYYAQTAEDVYINEDKSSGFSKAIISSIKNFTYNIGTLAYRNPSLYELEQKQKMP